MYGPFQCVYGPFLLHTGLPAGDPNPLVTISPVGFICYHWITLGSLRSIFRCPGCYETGTAIKAREEALDPGAFRGCGASRQPSTHPWIPPPSIEEEECAASSSSPIIAAPRRPITGEGITSIAPTTRPEGRMP